MIHHVNDVQMSFTTKSNLMREIEARVERGPTVPRVTLCSVSSDRLNPAVSTDPTNALPCIFAKPNGLVRTANDSEWIIQFRGDGRAAIPLKPPFACACDGLNRPFKSDSVQGAACDGQKA
jgi:hypothetical protein